MVSISFSFFFFLVFVWLGNKFFSLHSKSFVAQIVCSNKAFLPRLFSNDTEFNFMLRRATRNTRVIVELVNKDKLFFVPDCATCWGLFTNFLAEKLSIRNIILRNSSEKFRNLKILAATCEQPLSGFHFSRYSESCGGA